MPDLTQFALYFAAAFLPAITPGPGIFYVAAYTLAGGRAEGIASSFGTGLGGMVHVLAGSLGVSAIVLASAELFTALKLVGAIYLVWLGIRTFQAARREARTMLEGGAPAPAIGAGRAFREGVLVEAFAMRNGASPQLRLLLATGVLGGFLFAFLISANNVTIALFVAGARTETLPVRMFHMTINELSPVLAAISTLFLAFTMIALVGMEKLIGVYRTLEARGSG